MTKKILLTIKPADYYFFGGENTFDESRGEQNYLVRSNRLPQQTAVLGLIRHALFLYDKNRIGKHSFNAELSDTDVQDFGAIHKVSPLFLQKVTDSGDPHFLMPAPKTWLENGAEIQVETGKPIGEGYTQGTDFHATPYLFFNKAAVKSQDLDKSNTKPSGIKTWTEKEQLGDYWISMHDGSLVEASCTRFEEPVNGKSNNGGIFTASLHIGIDKQSRFALKGSADEGFYKQGFIRLAPAYSFAVVIEIDSDIPLSVFCKTMPFGGESRTVILEAVDWDGQDAKWQPQKVYGNHDDRITLMSDAWLGSNPQAIFDLCQLVIGDIKPFRHIRTPDTAYTGTAEARAKEFANLHLGKTGLSYLLERGAVLFPKKGAAQDILDKLKYPNFHHIGYNHFHPFHTTI